MDRLKELTQKVTEEGALIAATLSGLRPGAKADGFTKVLIKPVMIRGAARLQFEQHYPNKVTHQNLAGDEAARQIAELLGETFLQGQFFTREADYQVIIGKTGNISVRTRPPSKKAAPVDCPAAQPHNRQKNYLLPEGEPVDFLIRLGVMTRQGKVVAARYDKFRQINRFLEMVVDVADHLETTKPLQIVDFGSGKSYLTFALYHYLRHKKGRDVRMVGLDLKADVIAHCETIARDLGYDGLSFRVGDIRGYEGFAGPIDMVVTLHACDTATDDALAKAVAWNASVILSVPCCQHELFKKLRSDVMRPMLKHGILKERLTALVTDSLRGQMLEMAGYSVQMLEFIDLEHTPKNLLIRAVRGTNGTAKRDTERLTQEYAAFRNFWNIAPYIERAFDDRPDGDAGEAPGCAVEGRAVE